jgi:hypothetical protein
MVRVTAAITDAVERLWPAIRKFLATGIRRRCWALERFRKSALSRTDNG